jgi:hypothetical protein
LGNRGLRGAVVVTDRALCPLEEVDFESALWEAEFTNEGLTLRGEQVRLLEEQDVRRMRAEAASEAEQRQAAALPGGASKEGGGAEERQHDPEPCLKIHVIAAKGLKAMDRGGTSDPYCILHLGSPAKKPRDVASALRRQSTVKKKQLDPEWDEHFELPLASIGESGRGGSEADEVRNSWERERVRCGCPRSQSIPRSSLHPSVPSLRAHSKCNHTLIYVEST